MSGTTKYKSFLYYRCLKCRALKGIQRDADALHDVMKFNMLKPKFCLDVQRHDNGRQVEMDMFDRMLYKHQVLIRRGLDWGVDPISDNEGDPQQLFQDDTGSYL